jgi:hypothetical protein
MTKTSRSVRGGLLAAIALLALGPAPARATAVPGDWLYLTVTTGEAATGATRGALLLCDPPRGHVRAAQACDELRAVRGDIARIQPRADAICPMVYAPVTVTARGEWAGQPTEYSRTFSNSCVMAAETRTVFALTD